MNAFDEVRLNDGWRLTPAWHYEAARYLTESSCNKGAERTGRNRARNGHEEEREIGEWRLSFVHGNGMSGNAVTYPALLRGQGPGRRDRAGLREPGRRSRAPVPGDAPRRRVARKHDFGPGRPGSRRGGRAHHPGRSRLLAAAP